MNALESNEVSLKSMLPCTTDWNAIKWHKVEKYVNKSQKRIYRAASLKDFHKVKILQRMFINSDAFLLMAIKKVTLINKGRNTSGVDGFTAISTEQRAKLFDTMKNKNIKLHRPKPVYRRYIKKKNGKTRSLGIPTIIDRVYQEIIRMALEPQMEFNFEPTSYGFRPKRGCHDAVSRIEENLTSWKWDWVFEGDFKSCFDTLSHDFILNEVKRFPAYNLIERFLKAGYMDNNIFHDTGEGTPQGGILSPLLANIALNGMEKCLNIFHKEKINKSGQTRYLTYGKYRMVRYADDFLIFARNKNDIDMVRDILKSYLKDRGLELSEDKTRITHVKDGFDFLGFNFRKFKRKKGYKYIVSPSKDSVKSVKSKIADICKEYHGNNVYALIKRLNSLIIGVANYWKVSSTKKMFYMIDNYVWGKIYRFIKRLHPNKSIKWLNKTYFPIYNDGIRINKWILTCPKGGITLNKMSWNHLKNHDLIESNSSPYDKSKAEYFNNRNLSACG